MNESKAHQSSTVFQSEVAELESTLKTTPHGSTAYLVPDAMSLCGQLHLVRRLVTAEKMVMIIPIQGTLLFLCLLKCSFAISKNYTLISVLKKALIVDLEVRKPHPRSQSVVPSHSLPWETTMIAHEKSLAGLAQSVERLTEEREVARSIPRAGPVFRVLK